MSSTTFRRMLLALVAIQGARLARADVNAPAMLQWFEGNYASQTRRTVDFFEAGYGAIWVPPPGVATSGSGSVGYDPYNRFNLGTPGNPTRYGTQLGIQTAVKSIQQTGAQFYADLVWNHNGTSDSSTPGFVASGGYPGFVLSWPGTTDGDFHSAYATGDQNERLAGLIDIAQESNNQMIRNPVTPGNPLNIPAGTVANIPTTANLQYYPNESEPPARYIYNPATGQQNIPVWNFDSTSATQGTPVPENALGYLMRNAQWLVQVIGVDGFRLDATKNYPSWVLGYYDQAVYHTSNRYLLNGQQEQIFAFGEYYDGSSANIQTTILKNINSVPNGTVGGNRDALDFPLYFAMQSNLTNNGYQNSWLNVIYSSLDGNDDGNYNNGSQGVSFVQSADSPAPYLSNVAYAYTLMRPGNAIVYYNAHADAGSAFPQDGRGDALGGQYGTIITTLTTLRNEYSQGNYIIRDSEKETLIIERSDSLVAAYSNRLDAGYDSRTVQTNFAPGTPLIELTGNAANPAVNPTGVIKQMVIVNSDGTININVPRNVNVNGVEDDLGYVIYGPATPQGMVSLTNVAMTLSPDAANAANNGTARVSSIYVVKANEFSLRLITNQVYDLGTYRDPNADGDNALFKFDGGVAVNGDAAVDYTTPNTVTYGFETFNTYNSPLYGGGTGLYTQDINTTNMTEGMHYIEVIAFRHRDPSEPPVYTDWRIGIYIDRLPPNSIVQSLTDVTAGKNENEIATIQNTDMTGNNVHVLLDLPSADTAAQILAMLGSSTQATQTDTNVWTKEFDGMTSGNHVLTVVTYEQDGTYNIQRYPGYSTQTIYGAGLGDVNFDGTYSPTDVELFAQVYDSNGALFNPAADLNGDGLVNYTDLILLGQRLVQVNASQATLNEYYFLLSTTVPEPATLSLLALPAALLTRRRRTAPHTSPTH